MSFDVKKEYEWTSGFGLNFKLLEQIQLSSNGKIALFFGVDVADSNSNKLDAKLYGVYDKEKKK